MATGTIFDLKLGTGMETLVLSFFFFNNKFRRSKKETDFGGPSNTPPSFFNMAKMGDLVCYFCGHIRQSLRVFFECLLF